MVIFHRFLLTFTRPGNTLVPLSETAQVTAVELRSVLVTTEGRRSQGSHRCIGDGLRILEDPMRRSNPIKVSFTEIGLIRYDWIDD